MFTLKWPCAEHALLFSSGSTTEGDLGSILICLLKTD